MKIIIGGDLVPTDANQKKIEEKNFIDYLGEDFKKIWLDADYRMFNLECPLTEPKNKIDKCGPNLIASPESIVGIKSLKPDLIFLSNNHILDYGIEGLDNTIGLLEKEKLNYTGIINNSLEKNQTFIIEKEDIKVGIYNVCENEFSVATKETKGANPLNEIKNYKEVKEASEKCDYLIVSYHGGKEFYRYPSPHLQEVCRNFIDFGASMVITQHSHCVGCEEEYNNGRIIYGQGNFIFNKGNDEYWANALLIELEINEKGLNDIKYYPIEKHNGVIKISKDENIIKNFNKRSEEIKENGVVEKKYADFADKNLNVYLYTMNKVRFYKKVLNRLFNRKYFIKTYNKKDCLAILNCIECEAHRELFIKGLKNKIKKDDK